MNKNSKRRITMRIFCVFMVIMMLLMAIPSASADGAVTGEQNEVLSPSDPAFGYYYRFVTEDTIEITDYQGYESEVIIPSEIDGYKVVGIANFSVTGTTETNMRLKKIVIPDTVTYIGEHAFMQNPDTESANLEEIVLSKNLKTIGEGAFQYLRNLKSITIPASVTEIGEGAFTGCISLEEIIFQGEIPTLRDMAFGCRLNMYDWRFIPAIENLYNDWYCNENRSDFFIWNDYLLSYDGTSKNPVIPDGVRQIASGAFYGSEIESVTIPDSVESIGSMAFEECKSLKSVTIPSSVKRLEWNAFANCEQLAEVKFSEGLKYIGEWAFSECVALTEINLPDGLEEIDSGAFEYCENIVNITFPNTLLIADESVVYGTSWFDNTFKDGDEIYLGSVFLGIMGDQYPETLTVRAGTLAVDFSYCNGLKKINLPAGLKRFTMFGLEYCEITELNIPESVEYIDCGNFPKLETLNLPERAELAPWAFSYCPLLKSLTIPKGNKVLTAIAGSECDSLESITLADDVLEIRGEWSGIGGENLKYIDLANVKIIGEEAFHLSSIESITLPDTVVQIDLNAFWDCTSLKTIKGGKNVKTIGGNAFEGCTSLSDIGELDDGGVREICAQAFHETQWYYNQPDGVIYIGDIAYCYKGEMPENTVLAIREGTRVIGNGFIFDKVPLNDGDIARFSQPNLKALILPQSCKLVGLYSFGKCPNLERVDLGGTEAIWTAGFISNGIQRLDLPESMLYIDKEAFYSDRLTSIYLNDGLRVIENDAFLLYTGENPDVVPNDIYIPASVNYIGYYSVGYCIDVDGWPYVSTDYTIYGYNETAAQQYAEYNEITFVDLQDQPIPEPEPTEPIPLPSEPTPTEPIPSDPATVLTDEVTGVSVEGDIDDDVTLNVEETETDIENAVAAYDITLEKDGVEVQPNGDVRVTLPVPPGKKGNRCSVKNVNGNTVVDMNADLVYDTLVFTTNHFSVYVIVEDKTALNVGDVDGDGIVSIDDVTYIQKFLAKYDTAPIDTDDEEQFRVADANGDGIINITDATTIQRYLAGFFDSL